MYDKMDLLADKPDEIIMKMKFYLVWQQQNVNSDSIKLLPLAENRTKSERRNSNHILNYGGSDSWSNDSCSESEKYYCKDI